MSSINKATEKALVSLGAILLTGGIAAPVAAALIARNAARGFAEESAKEHKQPESKDTSLNNVSVA